MTIHNDNDNDNNDNEPGHMRGNDNNDNDNNDNGNLVTGVVEAAGYKVGEIDKGLGIVASD